MDPSKGENIENPEKKENPKQTPKILLNESQKTRVLLSLCLMAIFDFSGHSLPITIFPAVASERGLSSTMVGIIFSLFPFAGFFTSAVAGKLMRFFKKYQLLFLLLLMTCLSKIGFGLAYYFESETGFIILSSISRASLGFAFSAYQPTAMSYIPEIWPEDIVKKLSYFEISLNLGLLSGPIVGALIYTWTNYFLVFLIMSLIHFIVGTILLFTILRVDEIVQFEKDKKPLELKKMVSSLALARQFLFQALFLGGIMFIYSDFENNILELGGTEIICSLIYGLNMVGFFIGLSILNTSQSRKPVNRKYWFFASSILLIIFNNFFGPAPFLGIEDDDWKLVIIGIGFLAVGVAMGAIIPLLVPEYIDILRGIFLEEKQELLIDMGPALYISSYSLIEFLATILGGVTVDNVGFAWTSVIYAGVLLVYFVFYWLLTPLCLKKGKYVRFEDTSIPTEENKNQE